MEEMHQFFDKVVPLALMVIGGATILFVAWFFIRQKPIKPVIKNALLASLVIVMFQHVLGALVGEGDKLANILMKIITNILGFVAEALNIA
jgi:heme A synthase